MTAVLEVVALFITSIYALSLIIALWRGEEEVLLGGPTPDGERQAVLSGQEGLQLARRALASGGRVLNFGWHPSLAGGIRDGASNRELRDQRRQDSRRLQGFERLQSSYGSCSGASATGLPGRNLRGQRSFLRKRGKILRVDLGARTTLKRVGIGCNENEISASPVMGLYSNLNLNSASGSYSATCSPGFAGDSSECRSFSSPIRPSFSKRTRSTAHSWISAPPPTPPIWKRSTRLNSRRSNTTRDRS